MYFVQVKGRKEKGFCIRRNFALKIILHSIIFNISLLSVRLKNDFVFTSTVTIARRINVMKPCYILLFVLRLGSSRLPFLCGPSAHLELHALSRFNNLGIIKLVAFRPTRGLTMSCNTPQTQTCYAFENAL